ncbi:MAG: flagellar basal body rod protein FlgC [Syntrophomonadaceae bacterium]|nr:flagellar basal body rod protein FlgC [Syntrophomonadaceae bacterium]
MTLLSTMDISTSGLSCERKRMELIAQNIANIETTETNGEGPYRRKVAVFQEVLQQQLRSGKSDFTGQGVRISEIVEDRSDPLMVYDPQHPDANAEGFVAKPNLNLADEIVDSISAARAYAADVTVLNTTKSLAMKALTIGRG